MSRTREVETPSGPARAHLDDVPEARALLVLGHGAGGGVEAPDLLAARAVALEAGLAVARVEQPYRVAGRRSPAPARALDEAWAAVVAVLRAEAGERSPVIVGGRSSGARVACRTAPATGATGVLCLAFPLQPPGGRDGSARPSRLPELESAGVPVLVVQGRNDRFGIPPAGPGREVVLIDGDHGLKRDAQRLRAAIAEWLETIVGAG